MKMLKCKVLKPFSFSKDGINLEQADTGNTLLLPARLVQGLLSAGYVVEEKAETKVIMSAPETKPSWIK